MQRQLKLQRKISLGILAAFLVIAALFSSIHISLHKKQVALSMAKVRVLLQTLVERDREPLANEIFEHQIGAIELRVDQMLRVDGITGITVFNAVGHPLHTAGEIDSEIDRQRIVSSGSATEQVRFWQQDTGDSQTLHFLHHIDLIGQRLGWIAIAYDLEEIVAQQRHFWLLFVGQMVSLLLVLVLILDHFMRRSIVRPIAALQRGIERMASGRLDERVQVSSDDEIGQLARSFNHMMTDRGRFEALLRDNEEDLRITLNSIGDAVIAVDREGRIRRFNQRASELCGHTEKEALATPLTSVLSLRGSDSAPWPDDLPSLAAGGARNDLMLDTDANDVRLLAATWAPIRAGTAEDDQRGLVIVLRDITDQARLAEQLRQSEKMQALGQLAGGVAHDFNNMLQVISGHRELMEFDPALNPSLQRSIDEIGRAVDRSADLVSKLLTFARKGQAPLETVDIHAMIAETLAMLRHSIDRRIRLVDDLQARHALVRGDTSQLQNALLNLGVNARDAMPDGGELSYATRDCRLDEQALRERRSDLAPGRYLEISVRDNGAGIPESIRDRVFEPFFTTKAVGKGTGLGLAAVFGCVEMHGGAIQLDSQEGVGTYFRILLPICEATESSSDLHAQPTLHQAGSGVVLVIDDEEEVRELATSVLGHLGYECLSAANGAEGLAHFERDHARIVAVILDHNMPVMNGVDCFHRLRAVDGSVPILMASGVSEQASMLALRDQGLAGFLQKPYSLRELGDRVAELVRVP